MFKARVTTNVANGVMTAIPASFAGVELEANAVIVVKDGASGPVVRYCEGTSTGGKWNFTAVEWPVYCANGVYILKYGAPNAILHYI